MDPIERLSTPLESHGFGVIPADDVDPAERLEHRTWGRGMGGIAMSIEARVSAEVSS
jgi:hypothetical protein